MAKADVFALSSEEEPFGLVLVEAMACGLPVVATCALGNGPQSVLADGKYGDLVPKQDSQHLAASLSQVLHDQSKRKALIEMSTQRYKEYSPKLIAQQWLKFLAKL